MSFCYESVTVFSTSPYFLLSSMKLKPVVFMPFFFFFQLKFPKIYALFYAKTVLHRNFFIKSLLCRQADCSPCMTLNGSFLTALVSPRQAQPLPGWSCALDDPAINCRGTSFCSTCWHVTSCSHLHWNSSIRYLNEHLSVLISHRILNYPFNISFHEETLYTNF